MAKYVALLRAVNVGGTGKHEHHRQARSNGRRILIVESTAAQNTMLMAATGVAVAPTLRPAAAILAPAITPILALQLYSIAGAR